ncbi:MAG TPA: hypothetical protein VME21_04430 [Steroidobacteraceae bacterium]|nr:hypothetical protein [Steroidobacteraceae bacterium]
MITFVVLAVLLTLGTATAIAVPLLRKGGTAQASWTALAVLALLAVGAGSLYLTLSNWSWSKAAAAENSPQGMVAKLARRLSHQPDDLDGWLLLGRSYMVMDQTQLAIRAYERADKLAGGRSADALIGLAEALAEQDETSLGGRAGKLIEQALVLSPHEPKALFFGAAAAVQRGDLPLARRRFAALLELNPPANVRTLIQQQIEAIDQRLASNSPGGGATTPRTPAGGASGAAADATADATAGPTADPTAGDAVSAPVVSAAVRVKVALSPQLRGAGNADAPLFVFVRDPKQPGPPLAVKRLETRFPQLVELTASDAMIAGRSFVPGQDVQVVARIARSGKATGGKGDPFGEVPYQVGRDGVVDVVIDRLTP